MFSVLRRRMALTAAFTALVAPLGATAAMSPAAAHSQSSTSTASRASYCGISWGSLPKATSPSQLWTGNISGVRSGRHTCFDRVVFDIGRGLGRLGYNVRYVNAVTGPSGLPVPVAGGAKLQITVHAPATMRIPSSGVVDYTGWQTFRQLKWVSSFEGQTDFGLGVRARLPMRVFTLPGTGGGQRLVVDVANFW